MMTTPHAAAWADLRAWLEAAAVSCCIDPTEFQRGRAEQVAATLKALDAIDKRHRIAAGREEGT